MGDDPDLPVARQPHDERLERAVERFIGSGTGGVIVIDDAHELGASEAFRSLDTFALDDVARVGSRAAVASRSADRPAPPGPKRAFEHDSRR
jgi:hypothetical protein